MLDWKGHNLLDIAKTELFVDLDIALSRDPHTGPRNDRLNNSNFNCSRSVGFLNYIIESFWCDHRISFFKHEHLVLGPTKLWYIDPWLVVILIFSMTWITTIISFIRTGTSVIAILITWTTVQAVGEVTCALWNTTSITTTRDNTIQINILAIVFTLLCS